MSFDRYKFVYCLLDLNVLRGLGFVPLFRQVLVLCSHFLCQSFTDLTRHLSKLAHVLSASCFMWNPRVDLRKLLELDYPQEIPRLRVIRQYRVVAVIIAFVPIFQGLDDSCVKWRREISMYLPQKTFSEASPQAHHEEHP